MKIIENFTHPVTVEQLNSELSGIGVQLIDIVKAGPESLMLYFDHIDGAADCLRLSAQRGPQGAPMLSVEFLPAEDEDAQQEPAEDVQESNPQDDDAEDYDKVLVAVWDEHTGGYYLADRRTNTVVKSGPLSRQTVLDYWVDVPMVGGPDDDEDTDAE